MRLIQVSAEWDSTSDSRLTAINADYIQAVVDHGEYVCVIMVSGESCVVRVSLKDFLATVQGGETDAAAHNNVRPVRPRKA